MLPNRVVCFVSIAAFFLMMMTPSAQAFFDPPWVTPAAPKAGDMISTSFRMGDCDARVEEPGFPQITRTGNEIRLIVYGVHEDTAELCVYPAATGTEPIGTLEAGSYALTVDFLYDDYLYGLTVINLGVIPITVTDARTAAPVPTLSHISSLVLLLILGGVSASRLRRLSALFEI